MLIKVLHYYTISLCGFSSVCQIVSFNSWNLKTPNNKRLCVFSQLCYRWLSVVSGRHLSDAWQMSPSGSSLLADAHQKNPVQASCPWVVSHCGQPASQVSFHVVTETASGLVTPLSVSNVIEICVNVLLFFFFSCFIFFRRHSSSQQTGLGAQPKPPPLYLIGAN